MLYPPSRLSVRTSALRFRALVFSASLRLTLIQSDANQYYLFIIHTLICVFFLLVSGVDC